MRAVTRFSVGYRVQYHKGCRAAIAMPSRVSNAPQEQPWQQTSRRQLFVEAAEGLESVMRGMFMWCHVVVVVCVYACVCVCAWIWL